MCVCVCVSMSLPPCASHGLAPPDGADADQTGQGSGLERVSHEASGPVQAGHITACRQQTGAVTFDLLRGSRAEAPVRRVGTCHLSDWCSR